MSTRTNSTTTPSITQRVQISSGTIQTSRRLEVRRSGIRNSNAQDQNARTSVNNRKRNNNPHHKKTHRPLPHHRDQADPDATKNGRSSSQSSSGDSEYNQFEESHSSVAITVPELNELSLNDTDLANYGAPARRGQISLNHLLNFSFPPRQQHVISSVPRKQRASNYQPFNKERFVNANFRFLVSSMGDYTIYQVDPDLLLQWENIEQVLSNMLATTNCRSSYKPNKKWRRCPICWDSVYAKDLKSVRFWAVRSIKSVGEGGSTNEYEIITMRLIQRNASSTLALPRSSTWPSRNETSALPSTPWHFSPDALVFSKLMLTSIGYMRDEYSKDLKDLREALQDARSFDSTEEIPFIEMAIVNIKEHLDKLPVSSIIDLNEAERRARELITISERIEKRPSSLEEKDPQVVERNGIVGGMEISSESGNDPPPFLPDEFREQPHIANILPHPKPEQKLKTKSVQPLVSNDGNYYFYQSEDGQHLYLHPLDIRILKQEFGTYERFPNEITVRIVGVEETTITEELRKRCKYLSHLPLSCDVTFLEVDLKGVVSDLTLQGFSRELRQRKNRREEKAHKERRLYEATIHKERRGNNNRQVLNYVEPFSQSNSTGETSSSSNYWVPPGVNENGLNKDNVKNSNTSTLYSGPKTVWGTPAVPPVNVTHGSKVIGENDGIDNTWNIPEEEVYIGKKQKKKKLVLMSTGGRRQL
ncbi:18628_t:CDS:10 [Acaulospora morrowiae]|uniref:18628_t:CDS:1 n=1 Tax=Acaulospora morrowiae TaxID=94023 RepID=A0A9N9A1H1_9GLOM|nr:18628_t:CDS:10 [Acaulospora morrowiae]